MSLLQWVRSSPPSDEIKSGKVVIGHNKTKPHGKQKKKSNQEEALTFTVYTSIPAPETSPLEVSEGKDSDLSQTSVVNEHNQPKIAGNNSNVNVEESIPSIQKPISKMEAVYDATLPIASSENLWPQQGQTAYSAMPSISQDERQPVPRVIGSPSLIPLGSTPTSNTPVQSPGPSAIYEASPPSVNEARLIRHAGSSPALSHPASSIQGGALYESSPPSLSSLSAPGTPTQSPHPLVRAASENAASFAKHSVYTAFGLSSDKPCESLLFLCCNHLFKHVCFDRNEAIPDSGEVTPPETESTKLSFTEFLHKNDQSVRETTGYDVYEAYSLFFKENEAEGVEVSSNYNNQEKEPDDLDLPADDDAAAWQRYCNWCSTQSAAITSLLCTFYSKLPPYSI